MHALQAGLPSSHFFLRNLQVKQPETSQFIEAHGLMHPRYNVPDRDRLCIFAAAALASAESAFLDAAMLAMCFETLACVEEDIEVCEQSDTELSNESDSGRDRDRVTE